MNKNESQFPQLSNYEASVDVSLKEFMQIISKGGRVTRSKRHIPSKQSESKTREKSQSLLRYEGEPSLQSYFSSANISFSQFIKSDYFLNKKLKRLSRHHLCQSCIFYQRNCGGGFVMRSVRLISKKAKFGEFMIEERDQANKVVQTRNIAGYQGGILAVPQALVFVVLNLEEFCQMFQNILSQLKNKYKRLKMEEFAQMQSSEERERSLQSEMIEENPQSSVLVAAESEKQQKNKSLIGLEMKSQEQIVRKQACQQESLEMLEKINQQLAEFDKKIFSKISKGTSLILWPSLVLQSLNCERKQLQTYAENERLPQEERKVNNLIENTVLQMAFDELLEEKGEQISEKLIQNQNYLDQKIQILLNTIEKTANQLTVIHFLGTQKTRLLIKRFIKWEEFNFEEVNHIIMKSSLRALADDVNVYINSLNKFKALENSNFDGKPSLFRIAKYETENGEFELCIPIRDPLKEEKKVLVRLIRENSDSKNGFNFQNEDLLRWVDQSKLKINATVPRQNQEQKKFYYILGKIISVEEALNYIYSDFYYENSSFINVLRLRYPKDDLRRAVTKDMRCIYCYYRMDKLPCYRCKFCLKFCHQECAPIHTSHHQRHDDTQVQQICLDIYMTDNDERVWQCEQCSPCFQCKMAVSSNYLKCNVCHHLFHSICGRLKGSTSIDTEQGKYTCENCLKCRMCSNKLKNQEYVIHQRNIFCSKCSQSFKNNAYCAICMKQMGGKWVQCDKKDCTKWIHLMCDAYFKDKESKEGLDKASYICPSCRLKDRRKIFKWVIDELKAFDENAYFYFPDYEEITGYLEVIENPLCIYEMREKVTEGRYDQNAYQLIKVDFELLVSNALNFNFPNSDPYYRAKILHIVGSKFLQDMRELVQCSQQFLVKGNAQEVFKKKRKDFYVDLYQNYLSYLLNFKLEKTRIEVKRVNPVPMQLQGFKSKLILINSFANSEFKFRIQKKPHKIQNLFNIPRLSTAAWRPIRDKICYYHPDQQNTIIFSCDICKQSYCCTKICFNHRVCTSCSVKGCSCDAYQCGCPPLRDKERKQFETKIYNALHHSKLQKREFTEYYRYCLKCVVQNLHSHWCYLCRGYCYTNYQKCPDCSLFYHLKCQNKARSDEMSLFFQQKDDFQFRYSNPKLVGYCHRCSCSTKNVHSLRQQLTKQIKSKAAKLSTINKYLPLLNYLYDLSGIRMTSQEIIALLYENYSAFSEKQSFFNDFLINFNTIVESIGNNKIIKSEFRDYLMNDISKKLQNQSSHSHQRCVNFVESKEMKEAKQSKKFYKIFSKWFNNLYIPASFSSVFEISCHLDHLLSKLNHGISLQLKLASPPNPMSEPPVPATNFKEETHFNYKNLERIKIEVITSYVSPKSKKNIYYTNKIEKFKNYLNFWSHYYVYREWERTQKQKSNHEMLNEDIENQRSKDLQKKQKEYEKYLRFHADHENLPDSIYKQQSSRSLLFDPVHRQTFNPFSDYKSFCQFKSLSYYCDESASYINNKSEMLCQYLSSFCLKIYEENKIVLKRGITCILNEGKRVWRVLKRYQNQSVELKLEKKEESWMLHINQWSGVVREISDIVAKLREIYPEVNTFEDVVEFMGFNMTYSTFYEPNHFTHLLQTLPMDELNRSERKKEVIRIYNMYKWHRQGNFSLTKQEDGSLKEYNYNVTKKQIFYLKKRSNRNQQEELIEPKVVPYITFEDIKKDLVEPNIVSTKQKQKFTNKEPTNDVYVAPSKIDRLGLFIRNSVKKHTIVAEYIGEIISEAMADVREKKFHFGCYMFGLTKKDTRFEIIDATFIGNMGRYLNHSCDPNCKAMFDESSAQPRIFIYTIRDVEANEQLTYDYQFKIDINERLVCKCKAHNCQGRLT